jgi:predicted flap endonuclease-1-like 5' DNA nuclease
MIDSQHLLGEEGMVQPILVSGRRLAGAIRQHARREADNVARATPHVWQGEFAVRIEVIEGIGGTHASALSRAGVTHVRHLLQRGATPGGREALSHETGLSTAQLLEWVNHIDLMRIRGVGAEYSDLLEAAGVESPVQLAQRSPARLAMLLAETNAQYPLVRRVPSEKVLAGWIWEARTLPRLITY